ERERVERGQLEGRRKYEWKHDAVFHYPDVYVDLEVGVACLDAGDRGRNILQPADVLVLGQPGRVHVELECAGARVRAYRELDRVDLGLCESLQRQRIHASDGDRIAHDVDDGAAARAGTDEEIVDDVGRLSAHDRRTCGIRRIDLTFYVDLRYSGRGNRRHHDRCAAAVEDRGADRERDREIPSGLH